MATKKETTKKKKPLCKSVSTDLSPCSNSPRKSVSCSIVSKDKRIVSQSQLDSLIDEEAERQGSLECFVLLNFGIRSSKEISFTPQRDYSVYNESDDTEEIIPHDELMQSFIGNAMSCGALFKY